jgi:benzoyl-CoA reductase/2-hydroxyglutaryl-CoA dehydratase subunit BcrC/BadD/HgdB
MGSVLPEVLTDLVENPAGRLVQEARQAGARAIGYTCSFVPEALLSVPGLFPHRMRAPGCCGTPMADTYLSSVLCSYPRAVLERALDGGFDHVDGWVFVASCDHVRRLHDNLVYLQEPPFHVMLDLPHKSDPPAVDWYADELRRLVRRLGEHFSVAVDDDAVRRAIAAHNEHLSLLRGLDALRGDRSPPLSGADFHRVLVASSTGPKDRLAPVLEELTARLHEQPPGPPPRARLMVTGSTIDDPGYLSVIESLGAVVVADRFCFGGMPGLSPLPIEEDPVLGLARHALSTTQCPRMMRGAATRAAYVLRKVREREVDGVVLATMKFCDLWGMESRLLADALREEGVPVLRVERETSGGAEGQLRTRVQAFLETLGR